MKGESQSSAFRVVTPIFQRGNLLWGMRDRFDFVDSLDVFIVT